MATTGTIATLFHPAAIRTARDLTLLLGRVGLAVLMIAHAKLEYDYGGGSIAGVGPPVRTGRRSTTRSHRAGEPAARGDRRRCADSRPGSTGRRRADGPQHARRLGPGPPERALRGRPHRSGDRDRDRTAEPGARRHRLRTLRARPPDRPPSDPPDASSGGGLDSLSRAATVRVTSVAAPSGDGDRSPARHVAQPVSRSRAPVRPRRGSPSDGDRGPMMPAQRP